jgi:SAM-dependent methyltransferase
VTFKDHFSGHAALYSCYRPSYPQALYAFLAEQTPAPTLVWDCATGNGQAAVALADHFERVVATDASAEQVKSAASHPRVDYRVAPAEASGLDDESVDLISVAQALHWFDHDAFFNEVSRVLRPGGLIAVWSYNLLRCTPAIDRLLYRYYSEIVGPFWPPERVHIENGYSDLPFPFDELPHPEFAMTTEWSLNQLLGYLATWSATRRYIAENDSDPLKPIEEELAGLWGEPQQQRNIEWPLTLRLGRKSGAVV